MLESSNPASAGRERVFQFQAVRLPPPLGEGGKTAAVFLWSPLAAVLLAGCRPEEKMVHYKPFMAGLEGVQTQTPAVVPKGQEPRVLDEESIGPESLVQENPDGTKMLHSRSGLHLMSHIQRTLAEGDDKLFGDQVLSELTKQEFLRAGDGSERGVQSGQAVREGGRQALCADAAGGALAEREHAGDREEHVPGAC